MKLCYSILICNVARNLIAINKLRLTEMRDSSQTSMHFKVSYVSEGKIEK